MRLALDPRARRLLRRLPRNTVYSAMELILLSLLALQCARLVWTLVTPLGPVGDWKAGSALRAVAQDKEAARLQAAVTDGLKAFEFALRRRVEGEAGDPVRLGATDEVPAAFRALVEEYYRSLARGGRER